MARQPATAPRPRPALAPIAVVGAGIRAPGGVCGTDAYWDVIAGARDLVGELPKDRLAAFGAQWDDVVTRGGYLERAFDFDARFFGFSPREARTVDPQHRLLLEVVWETFEDAALRPDAIAEATGVFVGITGRDHRQWLTGDPNAYTTVGNGHSFAAGRLAYQFDLRGPAYALDTACSSSLVAVYAATRALAAGDCDMAVAAGVNLVLSPQTTRDVARTGALSPEGSSRPFDADADGFVRGEACGAVLLKRLDDAVRDGDRIRAVIDGVAANQDGSSETFTAPSGRAQAELIAGLLDRIGISGDEIGYHEAHGTGTPLGDPVELGALAAALRPDGRGGRPLFVGSVKANLGHTESAAGIASLIKALLCLEHRTIPPQAHFQRLNPLIHLANSGIVIPTTTQPWDTDIGQRASVCSYGMSGTNAYAVLSAPPTPENHADIPHSPGFMVSARTDDAVTQLAARYRDHIHIAELTDTDFPAFAYTATHGRTRRERTAWITAAEPLRALAALSALADGRTHPDVRFLDAAEPLPWSESGTRRAVVPIPTYPWQHVTHMARVEEDADDVRG